jgi:histone H3/H4
MKLTESMLRKMIQEESRKAAGSSRKRKQKLNESLGRASEELYNAMQDYVEAYIEQTDFEDTEGACTSLQNEVDGFCSGLLGEY